MVLIAAEVLVYGCGDAWYSVTVDSNNKINDSKTIIKVGKFSKLYQFSLLS